MRFCHMFLFTSRLLNTQARAQTYVHGHCALMSAVDADSLNCVHTLTQKPLSDVSATNEQKQRAAPDEGASKLVALEGRTQVMKVQALSNVQQGQVGVDLFTLSVPEAGGRARSGLKPEFEGSSRSY